MMLALQWQDVTALVLAGAALIFLIVVLIFPERF